MTSKWLLLILYLLNISDYINSRESSLQCWKCDVSVESTEEPGVFQDGMYYYQDNQLFKFFF